MTNNSSIVIGSIWTAFFHKFYKEKKNANSTFNKAKKEFNTLNNQLSTKKFSRGCNISN